MPSSQACRRRDFLSNTGGSAGAIEAFGFVMTVESCPIQGNHVNALVANPPTGGIMVAGGSTRLVNCPISRNRGANTGGLNFFYGNTFLNGSQAEDNVITNGVFWPHGERLEKW